MMKMRIGVMMIDIVGVVGFLLVLMWGIVKFINCG